MAPSLSVEDPVKPRDAALVELLILALGIDSVDDRVIPQCLEFVHRN